MFGHLMSSSVIIPMTLLCTSQFTARRCAKLMLSNAGCNRLTEYPLLDSGEQFSAMHCALCCCVKEDNGGVI